MSDIVSVIIPCYNVEKYILRCLHSLEAQTYGIENLEIILIDDASTDNTLSIIRAFAQRYPKNATVIALTHNGKQGAARNKGMDLASGKYIMFVDSDDCIATTMIEKMHNKIVEYNCDEVRCGSRYFYSDEDLKTPHRVGNTSNFSDLTDDNERKNFILASMSCIVHSRLFRREVFEKNHIRFMENVFYEDAHFSGICCFYINSKYWLDEDLYYYFQNPASTMSSFSNQKNMDHIAVSNRIMDELKERGIYDDVMSRFYHEFNAFYCWMIYINSLTLLRNNYLSQIGVFRDALLKQCPDIKDNAYVQGITDPVMKSFFDNF